VLGILPIAFFLVLSATSHQQLAPVYRSAAGGGMVIAGLVLEALAYLWIRHLLKVEV
jgi:Flp pilus assembly protein TadB